MALAAVACTSPDPRPFEVQVLMPALPNRLDPYKDSRMVTLSVLGNVFEPLVQLGPDGKVTAAIARSWESHARDVFRFRLRRDVRFHDGGLLLASDVVDSVQAARSGLLAGQLSEVVGVEALDDETVVFRTAIALDTFVYLLTAVPISRRGPSGEPVGTGPFELVEFRPGEVVRLQRFRGWHGHPALVAAATFRPFADTQEALQLLALPPRAIVISPSRGLVESLRGEERFRVVSRPGRSLHYLAFGLTPPPAASEPAGSRPFLDVRVRRAVRAALDLERLVEAATAAGGSPATQLVTPGGFGFNPSLSAPAQDLAEARRLLREAGYSSGFETVLDIGASDHLLGEEVARQLLAAGIRVKLNVLGGDAFLERIDAGQSPFFAYNWVLGRGSGAGFMSFFHSRDPARGRGLRNRTGYSNPTVDAALEAVVQEPAGSPNRTLMQQSIMRILMEDLPWVPLYSNHTARIYSRGLDLPWRDDGLLRLWEASLAKE